MQRPATSIDRYRLIACKSAPQSSAASGSHFRRPAIMWHSLTRRALLKPSLLLTILILVLCLFPRQGAAQAEQGTITGIVQDTTGAVIPGAKITATNTSTNAVSVTVSNSNGYFTLPYLTYGYYDVAAAKQGFQQKVVVGIHLTVNLSTNVKFSLKPGTINQTVKVQASAIQLETVNSELGGTAGRLQINELPQLGRNPLNFMLLQPGVIPEGERDSVVASVNGGMTRTSNVLLDGTTQMNTSTGNVGYTPPMNSVGELKLVTNNFSAQYGMSGAGIVTMSTKYGTNTFHGSAYEYMQNTIFKANGWYPNHVGQPRTPLHYNEYGFTLGGPVLFPRLYNGRNKTFFFVNFQWNPTTTPDPISASIPTAAMRTGDFSGLVDENGKKITIYDPDTTQLVPGTKNTWTRSPFPGNIIPPGRINPIALKVLNYYPLPNSPGTEGIYNNYQATPSRTTKADNFLIRVDQNFGTNNKAFIFIGRSASTAITPLVNIAFPQTGTNGNPGEVKNNPWTGAISDTWTITPNLLAEFRGNFSRALFQTIIPSQGFDVTTLGLPTSFGKQVEVPSFPQFSITDAAGLGLNNSAVDNDAEGSNQGQAHITWVKGPHTIETGFEYRFAYFNEYRPLNPAGSFTFGRNYTQGPNPVVASEDAGWGLASLLLGIPGGGDITQDQSATFSQKNVDAYINDDYKATSTFTLNLGIRYDGLTGWTDRHNQLTWFNPVAPDPITGGPGRVEFAAQNGNPRDLNSTSNYFSPRLGFAYQIGTKTVIRGGYGMNADTGSDFAIGNSGYQVRTNLFLGPPSPAPDTPPPGGSISNPYVSGYLPYPGTPSSLVGSGLTDPLRTSVIPTMQDYNLSVQRAISSGTVVTAAYAGSRGEHLWNNNALNVAPIGDLSLGSQLTQQVKNPYAGLVPGVLGAPTIAQANLLVPFPQYDGITWSKAPVGDSYYNALTLQLQHQDKHGLFLQVAYTLSKAITDIPERFAGRATTIVDPSDLGLSRGLADYDRTQYAVVNYIYQLPFGPGQKFLQHGIASNLLGNWQLAGVTTYGSGIPVIINGPNSTHLPGISALADRLHDPHLKNGAQNPQEWFDTTAYAPAAPFTTGTGNRVEPDLRGPAYGNWDMSLDRKQKFPHDVILELRLEAFNAFNNRNLGPPNGNVTNGLFGQITSSGQARTLQIGAVLTF